MSQATNLKTSKYRNILFDLDGTLTDPKEGITNCIQYALEKLNFPIPKKDDLEWCIGPPLYEIFEKLCHSSCKTLLSQAVEYYRERFAKIGLYENFPYPDIDLVLYKLCQSGLRLFVATSKPQIFAEIILKHFSLDHYFEKIHGSELDHRRSDKKELLKYILESHSLNPNETLMVGDRKFDIIAAQENNLDHLSVTYGYGSINELRDAGALFLCDSPLKLYNRIYS